MRLRLSIEDLMLRQNRILLAQNSNLPEKKPFAY
jgi:hypothetical protein